MTSTDKATRVADLAHEDTHDRAPDRDETPDRPALGPHVEAAVRAAEDKKALDVRVLDLRAVCDFSDCFVIATAANDRQAQAIAEAVERQLRTIGERPVAVEGSRTAKWVLLDYTDLVVHVFQPDTRSFYALERLWSDAEDVTERFTSNA